MNLWSTPKEKQSCALQAYKLLTNSYGWESLTSTEKNYLRRGQQSGNIVDATDKTLKSVYKRRNTPLMKYLQREMHPKCFKNTGQDAKSAKKLYTGPRGGKYYMRKGKKVYVK